MTTTTRRAIALPPLLAGTLVLAGIFGPGCATGGAGGIDASGGAFDARVGEGGRPDARADGASDSGPDLCGSVVCELFERCVAGTCRPYPACAGDGTCPTPGDVCTARYCVPGDVDVDGDGSPASMDCDETNPSISPLEIEACNMIDDNCNDAIDEGDPTVLCEPNPGGGICIDGSCGCPAGTYDLDRAVPGCECVGMPALTDGQSCATAIDLGTLSDAGAGQSQLVSGNVLPVDRVVWYRFLAQDSPDTSCDNFHVRVQLTANPDDTFEFSVFRGTCDTSACGDASAGFTDFRRAVDFTGVGSDGTAGGECPCTQPTGGLTGVTHCSDNSEVYYVSVRRRAASTLSCSSYTLQVSNGAFDS